MPRRERQTWEPNEVLDVLSSVPEEAENAYNAITLSGSPCVRAVSSWLCRYPPVRALVVLEAGAEMVRVRVAAMAAEM